MTRLLPPVCACCGCCACCRLPAAAAGSVWPACPVRVSCTLLALLLASHALAPAWLCWAACPHQAYLKGSAERMREDMERARREGYVFAAKLVRSCCGCTCGRCTLLPLRCMHAAPCVPRRAKTNAACCTAMRPPCSCAGAWRVCAAGARARGAAGLREPHLGHHPADARQLRRMRGRAPRRGARARATRAAASSARLTPNTSCHAAP